MLPEEKTARVGNVFDTVAQRYDVMNDVMSLGLHRLVKRIAIECTGTRAGDTVLDIAGGTGDMAVLLRRVVGSTGKVTLLDINQAMLRIGRDRLIDEGFADVTCVVGDGEQLPFADGSVDAITIGFGLRNMTNKETALRECRRILRDGRRLVIVEFSKPANPLVGTLNRFRELTLPVLGRIIVGQGFPYSYLTESIEQHPTQAALKLMLEDSGLKNVKYENLLGGIVAIHRGEK